jgi:RNA polymerase sigma-70 factor, ECF subfamily
MKPGSGRQATGSSDHDGRILHARLLRRDSAAPSDLADHYLDGLVTSLRRAFLRDRVDDDLLVTIAIELILDVGERPEQYDPDRLGLSPYLLMAAKRDVLNALQSERRRADRQVSLENVELRAPAWNRQWANTSDPADKAVDAFVHERAATMRAQFVGRDREVVDLMLDGERRTQVFANVLGLLDRSRDEQVSEVKRAKDRLKKRMQRIWRRMSGDD